MANKIKLRRGLHTNLPTLEVGEPAFTTDTKKLYIGTTNGNVQIGEQSDWTEIDTAKESFIKNKPTLFSGSYTDLTNKPTIPTIPNIEADNGTAETGKYISQVAIDTTNKHKILITKATLPSIPVISTNITTDATSDVKTVSPKAVKTYIDTKVASAYKASGNLTAAQVVVGLLVVGNLGNVYNVTQSFTTNANFVEDNAKVYPAGTNIVVVDIGSGVYKFDILAGFIDTSAFLTAVPAATTTVYGGIKINYTTATPKHKVELDGSGNAFVNLTNLTIDGGEWA